MKRTSLTILAAVTTTCVIASMSVTIGGADGESSPLFGIEIPPGYRDWTLISVAHEAGDLNDLRAILGNDVAIKAYREGKLPFPDGAIIARLAWDYTPSEENNKVFGRAQSFVAGFPQMFSSWSRTRRNTPRQVAGDLLNSRTANLPAKRCSTPAFPATCQSKRATLSSRDTHLDSPSRRDRAPGAST